MGWPFIMYLSRAKTVAVWPELEQMKGTYSLEDVKASVNLSLSPKLDVVGQWKKTKETDPPARDRVSYWPPREALQLAVTIEDALRKRKAVGSAPDFLSAGPSFPCYKLQGKLTLDKRSCDLEEAFGPRRLNTHCLTGHLLLYDSDVRISLVLSLESVAGVTKQSDTWNVEESGTHYFLERATGDGAPIFGLFMYQGQTDAGEHSCGIVYFACADHHAATELCNTRDKEMKTLSSGINLSMIDSVKR